MRRAGTEPYLAAAAGVAAAAVGIAASAGTRADPAWMWLPMQGVGLSFVVAGTIAWRRRPDNGTGALMSLVGIVWYVIDLRYSTQPVLFAVGFCGFYLPPVVFTHLVLALPGGRLVGRWERIVAVGLYGSVLATQTMRFVTEHPRAPQSWTTPSDPASTWAPIGSGLGLALSLAALVLVIRRWRAAGRPARRRHALVWSTGAAVGLIVIVSIVASLVQASPDAHRRLAITYIVGLILTPFAILVGLLRVRMARLRVADLVVRLHATADPVQVRSALAAALDDPGLQVRFRLHGEDRHGGDRPGQDRHVDPDGRPVPAPQPGQPGVTLVQRDGQTLAALIHDPILDDQRSLVDSVVAAAGLALDNARLHAVDRARLADVRESRRRIMASADAERRRIQRDLHDGAQHRLLAIAMLVGRAAEELPAAAANRDAAALLERVGAELNTVIRDLRHLTEGLLPPVLGEQGLAAVVESMAERAPLPVTFTVTRDRFPDPVERAAYFIINEALTNVYKHAAARRATVRVAGEGGGLVVEVGDDGIGGADVEAGTGLRGLRDRAAAIGGTLSIHNGPAGGTLVVAELPCE